MGGSQGGRYSYLHFPVMVLRFGASGSKGQRCGEQGDGSSVLVMIPSESVPESGPGPSGPVSRLSKPSAPTSCLGIVVLLKQAAQLVWRTLVAARWGVAFQRSVNLVLLW